MTQCRGDEVLRVLPETGRIRAGFLCGATRVGKRSYRRAVRRAGRDGRALHKGKWYTAKQFGVTRIAMPTTSSTKPVSTKPVSNQFANKPGEVVRHGRLKCFSWNSGGLPLGTLDELMAYLEQHSFQIAFVQETRWKHTSMWDNGSYYCIHSGEDKRGNSWAGVLTIISKSVTSSALIRYHAPIDGRLLHVRVPTKCGTYDLVNCYQKPLTDHVQCQSLREQVWRALGRLLSQIPLRNAVVVSGDYNSPLIPRAPWIGGAACKPPARYNDEPDALGCLIELHDLCALNSWKGHSVATCVTAQGGCSTIDGILIRRSHADSVSKLAFPVYDCPLLSTSSTFHYPLCVSLPLLWRCWSKGSRPKTFLNKDGLVNDVRRNTERWQSIVAEAQRLLPTPDLSRLETYSSQVRGLCNYFYQVASQKLPHHKDNTLAANRSSRWRLLAELRKPSGSGIQAVFRRWWLVVRVQYLTRISRKRSKQLRPNRLQEIFAEAALASSRHDVHGLFQQVRKLSPKTPKKRMMLRDDSWQSFGC